MGAKNTGSFCLPVALQDRLVVPREEKTSRGSTGRTNGGTTGSKRKILFS